MNNAIKAVRNVLDICTEYTAQDCKILNRVAKLIIKHGAVSLERLTKLTKLATREICWALWHLGAIETPAQLWLLPA